MTDEQTRNDDNDDSDDTVKGERPADEKRVAEMKDQLDDVEDEIEHARRMVKEHDPKPDGPRFYEPGDEHPELVDQTIVPG